MTGFPKLPGAAGGATFPHYLGLSHVAASRSDPQSAPDTKDPRSLVLVRPPIASGPARYRLRPSPRIGRIALLGTLKRAAITPSTSRRERNHGGRIRWHRTP